MENKLKEIASRIKDLREIANLSTQEMAQKTNVSEEVYCQLETGNMDFGFNFIYQCVHSTKCYYNGLCRKKGNTQAIINIKNKIGKSIPFKLEKHGNTKKKKN